MVPKAELFFTFERPPSPPFFDRHCTFSTMADSFRKELCAKTCQTFPMSPDSFGTHCISHRAREERQEKTNHEETHLHLGF